MFVTALKDIKTKWYYKLAQKEPCCGLKMGSAAYGLWEALYPMWPFCSSVDLFHLFLRTMRDAPEMSRLK